MDNAITRRNLVTGLAALGAGASTLGMPSLSRADETAPASFIDWALAGGNAGNNGAPFFLDGEENRPTTDEIERMLQAANTYFQCHFLSGVHFVVVRDQQEQADIFKYMGANGSGTVAILVFADGLRDQDIHAEQYFPGQQNGENPEYWQMPYALVETGMAIGYLNIAARELGYRMRTYGALNLDNLTTGENDPYIAGSFEYITRGMWDTDKYLEPKEGGDSFTHYTIALDREIEAQGNLTLVCACLIGKIDEVDATTGATINADYKQGMRGNYDFWD